MVDIAREAGAFLMPYFRRRVAIEYKGEADLVTEADRGSEELIRKRLKVLWPGHDIMGEEEGLIDTGSDYRWYIDPLDGTTNFAHSFPCSAFRWDWNIKVRWLPERFMTRRVTKCLPRKRGRVHS